MLKHLLFIIPLIPPNALSFAGAKVLLFSDMNKNQQSTFNERKLLVIRSL